MFFTVLCSNRCHHDSNGNVLCLSHGSVHEGMGCFNFLQTLRCICCQFLQEEVEVGRLSITCLLSPGLGESKWITVVDIEMQSVKEKMLELKEFVARMGTVLDGFQHHLRDIASQLKIKANEGKDVGNALEYGQGSGSSAPAPENQLRCPEKSSNYASWRTLNEPFEGGGKLQAVQLEPSSSTMKRRREEAESIAMQRRKVQAPAVVDESNLRKAGKSIGCGSDCHSPSQLFPCMDKIINFAAAAVLEMMIGNIIHERSRKL